MIYVSSLKELTFFYKVKTLQISSFQTPNFCEKKTFARRLARTFVAKVSTFVAALPMCNNLRFKCCAHQPCLSALKSGVYALGYCYGLLLKTENNNFFPDSDFF